MIGYRLVHRSSDKPYHSILWRADLLRRGAQKNKNFEVRISAYKGEKEDNSNDNKT